MYKDGKCPNGLYVCGSNTFKTILGIVKDSGHLNSLSLAVNDQERQIKIKDEICIFMYIIQIYCVHYSNILYPYHKIEINKLIHQIVFGNSSRRTSVLLKLNRVRTSLKS